MKKLFYILSAAVLLFSMAFMTACGGNGEEPEKPIEKPEEFYVNVDTFYPLQEVYDGGLLSRDDILHIAYFTSGNVYEIPKDSTSYDAWKKLDFTPTKERGVLTDEEEMSIKLAFYWRNGRQFSEHGYKSEEDAVEHIEIFDYAGKYGGGYVVRITADFYGHLDEIYKTCRVGDIGWFLSEYPTPSIIYLEPL